MHQSSPVVNKPSADPKVLLREGAASLNVPLEQEQTDLLLDLARRILEKSRVINLTGARDLATLVMDHILDSLALIPLIHERAAPGSRRTAGHTRRTAGRPLLVDVGSGGGFPSLPLAIALGRFDVLCIESVGKKARILEEICTASALAHVTIVNDRAERVGHDPQWRERADWATARGVGCLATASELTLPFLRPGGVFLAQKGASPRAELDVARPAIAQLGGQPGSIVRVGSAPVRRRRTVVIIEKIAHTPERFPRRPGLPAKRPIGGGKP